MKKYQSYILAYGGAALLSAMGTLLVPDKAGNAALIALGALSTVPVLSLAISVILTKLRVNKINNTKVADMHGYMLRHRDEAEQTSQSLLRKLQRIRRMTAVYTVLMGCLAMCAPLCGWLLYPVAPWMIFPAVFYAGTLLYVIFGRVPRRNPIILHKKALILKKENYPQIHEIARKAARKMGCAGDITILLTFDCNASIVRDGLLKYYLQLGAVLLNVLSEEELYCICIHEFSHCSKQNRPIDRERAYGAWISGEQPLPRFMKLVSRIFDIWDTVYSFDHMTYQYATAVYLETRADRDMAKHCDPAVAVSALLKLNYSLLHEWEGGTENEPSAYESEAPKPHCLADYLTEFKAAVDLRHENWDELSKREILSNNTTHPTFRMRLETLGRTEVKTVEDNSSPTYVAEAKKALELADTRLCENTELYEENRQKFYLEPLKLVSEWESNGKPLHPESYADILYALKSLGRNRDAEELCEIAIQSMDENSSHTAYFIKGCTMLHRYDPQGASYVFRAIDLNSNYLDEGLHQIGVFYCLTGMEKELAEYRERAAELAQQEKDEFSKIGFLSPKDNLVRDDMAEEMREEILSYILSVDEEIIQEIYLVRKIISESFFTSAFVIRFSGGTGEQKYQIMHKIFCYLDTYPVEWQFSLFDYANYSHVKFGKIEGSLVYPRRKDVQSV